MGSCNSKGASGLRRTSGLFISAGGESKKPKGFAETVDDIILKNTKTRQFLKRSLLANSVFAQEVTSRHITPEDMDRIADVISIKNFEPGERLFEKDDFPSDYLYIARQGIFRGVNDYETKIIFREGDLIGEVGFFHDCARLLTVIAEGEGSSVFALSKTDFKSIVEKGRDLNNIKILKSLTESQKYMLKDGMSVCNFLRGETILSEGEPINAFYIVLSGLIRVINTTYKENTYYNDDFCMYPGAYFGEENFLLNYAMSTRTFIALKDVTLCSISKELFNNSKIFQPAVEQIRVDVSLRLKENQTIQEKRNEIGVVPTSPSYSKEIRCLKKKNMKKKKVLWKKGTDSVSDVDNHPKCVSLNRLVLPDCACGLFPLY